jgi:hypothetical protein
MSEQPSPEQPVAEDVEDLDSDFEDVPDEATADYDAVAEADEAAHSHVGLDD